MNTKKLLKEIDMSKSVNALFSTITTNKTYPYNEESEFPIQVSNISKWETLSDDMGSFLKKKYNFGMMKHLMYFVNECLTSANDYSHYPEIMIKDNKTVEIVLYTKDVNDICEIDLKLSKIFDEIYSEIKIIYFE